MSSYNPPLPEIPWPIFNYEQFLIADGTTIDLNYLIAHYFPLVGGTISGNINCLGNYYLNGTLLDFSSLSGLTPGIVTASKLIQVDSNKDISSFRNLTSQNLLSTSTIQNNSTSSTLITSSSLGSDYGLHLHSTLTSSNGIYQGSSISFNNSPTDTIPLASIVLDKIGSGDGDLVLSTRNGVSLTERVRISDLGITMGSYSLNSTILGWFDSITPGVAQASHALVTGIFNEISSLYSVSSTFLSGDLTAPSVVNVTSGSINVINGNSPLSLRNTTFATGFDVSIQSTGTGNVDLKLVSPISNTLLGLYANGKRQLTLNSTSDIVNIVNHNGSTTGLSLNGTLITSTATKLNYTDITTLGTAQASKCLTVDSSLNLTGINNITSSGVLTNSFSNATSTLTSYQIWNNTIGPITCAMQLSNVGVWLGNSTNHPLRLATSNIVRMYINESGQFNIGTTNQTSYLFQIPGTCNINSLYLSGSIVNSTATELNYLSGLTPGTASASKALVLDGIKSITGLNTLSVNSNSSGAFAVSSSTNAFGLNLTSSNNTNTQDLNCSIGFSNDSTIGSTAMASISLLRNSATDSTLKFYVRNGTILGNMMNINSSYISIGKAFNSQVGLLTLQGNSSQVDGNYQVLLNCRSDNATPLSFSVEVDSRDYTVDTTYATWIGNKTLNDLKIGTNDATRMTIKSNGYVGINSTSPSTYLYVAGTVSNTYNIASQLYAIGSSTAYTTSQLGPVTVSVTADFAGPIRCTSIYCTSDRRVKKNINLIDENYADNFYSDKINIYTYNYKGTEDSIPLIGFIAQDLNKAGYTNLLTFSENKNLKFEEEGDIDDIQMSIDYSKISCINYLKIKKLMKRIELLEENLKQKIAKL